MTERERRRRKSDRVKQNWVQKAKLISKLLAGTAKKKRKTKEGDNNKQSRAKAKTERERDRDSGRERGNY